MQHYCVSVVCQAVLAMSDITQRLLLVAAASFRSAAACLAAAAAAAANKSGLAEAC
jgi:hypothetical protein